MSEILAEYPWMIGIIIVGTLAFCIMLIAVFKTPNKQNTTTLQNEEKQENINDGNNDDFPVETIVTKVVENEKKTTQESISESCADEVIEGKEVVDNVDATDVDTNDLKDTNEVIEKIEQNTEKKEDNNMATTKKVVKTTTTTTTKKVSTSPTKTTTIKTASTKAVAKVEPKVEPKAKRTPNGKYEIFEVEGTDSFKYILKASNGEKLIESDLFASKENVKNAIEAIKRSLESGKSNIHKDKNDMFQFKIIAGNNRPIAVSANYVSKQNAEKALESFKRFAANSPIVEVEEPKDSLIEEINVTREKLDVQGKILISNDSGTWTFKLFANNGELLCTSKPYSSKANCDEGVETFRTSVVEGKFLVVRDKNKLYQFKLQTSSKRLVVIGQTYEDKQRAISSAQSVASFSDDSKVVYE